MSNKKWVIAGLGVVAGLMLIASSFTAIGVFVGLKMSKASLSPLPLYADAAARSESLSFATGFVDNEVEGLYILDHQTGRLQCWVVNRQTGTIGGLYAANVSADMELEKAGDADFVMTTGRIEFSGIARAGNERPALSTCYVGDGNSGKVVGYSFYFDQTILNQINGEVQQGKLIPVCRGYVREGSRVRDQ